MHTLPEAQSPADQGLSIASRKQAGMPEEQLRPVQKTAVPNKRTSYNTNNAIILAGGPRFGYGAGELFMKEGMDEKKVSDWHLTEGENGAKGRVTRPSLEEYLRIGIRIKK